MRNIVVRIDFPALDRFVAYLESGQQKQIDALTETVLQLTQKMQQSETGLNKAIEENKHAS